MTIKFKNDAGLIRQCPVGFSWTTLFFGFFVPLARGWYSFAAIAALAGLITGGISWLVFPFIINKYYAKHLLESGYKPAAEEGVEAMKTIGIEYEPPSSRAA